MKTSKIGANTTKAREMTRDLVNQLNQRFPDTFYLDRNTWPTFIDKGAKQGMIHESRVIVVTHAFPYPSEGYRAVCANVDPNNKKRDFSSFNELCDFIQSNIN